MIAGGTYQFSLSSNGMAEGIYGHSCWKIELTIVRAATAESKHKFPRIIEDLDTVIIGVRHENVPGPIHGNAIGIRELSIRTSGAAKLAARAYRASLYGGRHRRARR